MPTEQIFWHEGLSYDTRSSLQKPGFLQTANNIVFEVDGKQVLRPSFSIVNATSLSAIHSIGVFRGNLLIGSGSDLLWNTGSGDFTSLGTFSSNRWVFKEYKQFFHGVNGVSSVLFDEDGNLYPSRIFLPSTSPSGAAGISGNPNGIYKLYVSYYITWPNGMVYETGLSAGSSDVTVTNTKIEWTNIPTSTYAAYSGVAPTIHRKLYRGAGTAGSLTGIYYIDTITDNTTTTYSDNFTDTEVTAGGLSDAEDFIELPNSKFLEYHYGRAFVIDIDKPWRLVYSSPATGETATENENILPVATEENNFDDVRVMGVRGIVDPQGIIAWAQNLYIVLNQTWMRKEGNDPNTWNYKKGFVSWGISAQHTLSSSSHPVGIMGLSLFGDGEPGLSIYNGMTSDIVGSLRLRDLFKSDLNKTYIKDCVGKCIGFYYHLFYPSTSSTILDTHLAMDLSHYPDVRISKWTDLYSNCIAVDESNGDMFIGGTDGYVRKRNDSGGETINVDVKSHDMIGGQSQAANKVKTLKKLKYNINTNGDLVKLEVTIDGVLQQWQNGKTYYEISGISDYVQVMEDFPNTFSGYIYNFRIYGAVDTFELYSPWDVEFDITV
jgi:hypothetical protein